MTLLEVMRSGKPFRNDGIDTRKIFIGVGIVAHETDNLCLYYQETDSESGLSYVVSRKLGIFDILSLDWELCN